MYYVKLNTYQQTKIQKTSEKLIEKSNLYIELPVQV